MSNVKYHKIKHLVEIEDDILCLFYHDSRETERN
jgi:hypothetical protein